MEHKEATASARELECCVCGCSPCEPAHYPRHRGMGAGHAGWGEDEWVPMCRLHHDALDKRNGTSDGCAYETRVAEMCAAYYRAEILRSMA